MENSNIPSSRRIAGDGTTLVCCKICGHPIQRQLYKGYSTATCYYCFTGTPRPDPEDEITPQNIPLQNDRETQKLGLATLIFKALGFGKKKKGPMKDSEKVAANKKRRPLFARTKSDEVKEDE